MNASSIFRVVEKGEREKLKMQCGFCHRLLTNCHLLRFEGVLAAGEWDPAAVLRRHEAHLRDPAGSAAVPPAGPPGWLVATSEHRIGLPERVLGRV